MGRRATKFALKCSPVTVANRRNYMRRYLLAAAAVAALSSPALARDGSVYVGIEGGLLHAQDMDGDGLVDFTSTPATPAGPADFVAVGSFDAELKRGYDIDAIIGYDLAPSGSSSRAVTSGRSGTVSIRKRLS
jgi:hypothetical protein